MTPSTASGFVGRLPINFESTSWTGNGESKVDMR